MAGRRPRVRGLEPSWVEHEGEQVLVLRDRTGVLPEPLAVQPVVGFILSLCDGLRDEDAIRELLSKEMGQAVERDQLASILDDLERALVLEGPAADAATVNAIRLFREAPARPAALGGAIYPAETGACRKAIAAYGKEDREQPSQWDAEIRGVVSPHIDYQRGGRIYHRVWQRAAPAVRAADVLVIFGTDHGGGPGTITLTRQSYDTPFGLLETDQPSVDAMASAIGDEAAFAEELHHRGEHSIELATVWAASLFDGGSMPTVVPVLCGSFHRFAIGEADPSADARIAAAIDALKGATADRKVVAVAAGDLAHVGPAFGDAAGYDAPKKANLRARDERLLHAIAAGRDDEFMAQIRAERDARRVCGLPPIYMMLRYLGNPRGEVVCYKQCPADDDGGSLVSVAGVLLW